jgi:hypothetical protein
VSKQDQLEWEARWARPAAICAFAAGILLLAQIVLLQTIIEDRPRVEAIPDFLLSVDERPGMLIASRGCQALAFLLLIPIFFYLYRAVQARLETIPAFFRYLIYFAPVLYAIGLIAGAIDQIDVAGDYAAGEPVQGQAGDDRAEQLLEDSASAPVFALNFAGQVGTAFLFVMLPLRARRVGLLSPFMSILGVVVGALLVLRLVPLVPDIVQAFWLGALGSLYLGNWPGGRGPAWESGEAEPWPSPAQRRGLAGPPAAEDTSRDSLLEPSEPVEPGPESEPAPDRPSSRKRKRKR